MRTRTRELEQMSGHGVVTEETGKTYAATYDLSRTQDELYDGSGDPPIRTSKNIIGRVLPVVSFDGFKTLQMDDGRRFKFFYSNSDGSIALNQWIG
jgi:hypothetical protein